MSCSRQRRLLSVRSTFRRAQYEDGLVDFNTVITTLQALVSQQDQLAAIQGTVTTNLVDLYKSLGGGWELRSRP